MKKLLGLLIIILVMNSVVFASFTDIGNNETYVNAIEKLVELGIINGYEDGTFRPSKTITRAEMTKIIVIAMNATVSGENNFNDVPNNHWAKEYISIGVANGYIQGDGDGNFRPDDKVNYGEVATILVRAMGYEKEANELDSKWPNNFMEYASKLGLFRGYQTNDLISINPARRDNVALMVYNMLNNSNEKENEDIDSKIPEDIDTKINYTGIITKFSKTRGENYFQIKNYNDDETELKLKSDSLVPSIGSFVIFKLNSKAEMTVRKELKIDDLSNDFILVNSVDKELISLDGCEELLDLNSEEYVLNGETLKLDKITFMLIELDNEENEFIRYGLYKNNELKLKEDDIIRFEDDMKVCFVIREVA